MKKAIGIAAAIALVVIIAFASYKMGEKNVNIMDDPTTVSSTTTAQAQDATEPWDSQDSREGATIPVDDMSTEEIAQFLRGKLFQKGDPHMAAGFGELYTFAPQGSTYHWFCSSMDGQARVRAEHGTWALKDGYIVLTAQKLIEWQGGHFAAPFGSIGSRLALEDFDQTLTEVDIESESNFQMFRFPTDNGDDSDELGFCCAGSDYFYAPSLGGIDHLREEYEEYFALLEQ